MWYVNFTWKKKVKTPSDSYSGEYAEATGRKGSFVCVNFELYQRLRCTDKQEAGYVITVKCSWENLGGRYTGVHHEAISICILEIFRNC